MKPAEGKVGSCITVIMVAWLACRFDSGSSWAGVLSREGLALPADLYLEGSDQHRGETSTLPSSFHPFGVFFRPNVLFRYGLYDCYCLNA